MRSLVLVLGIGGVIAASACSLQQGDQDAGMAFEGGDTTGTSSGAATSGAGPSGTSGGADTSGSGGGAAEPGTLTAGAWDDNLNFDFFAKYLKSASAVAGAPLLTEDERNQAHTFWLQPRASKQSLDVALVVDNTGSMEDEITYLRVEFDAIVGAIQTKFPGVPQRWATVAYRDAGDVFVTQASDFTSDLAPVKADLAAMAAEGGGDYPEGVNAALSETMKLSWQSDARLVFWIADAPHHVGEEKGVTDSLRTAQGLDVHIYPVAASGTDNLTELTMRSAAQLTGGRYLFLTDDSGVGGPHAEPHIPCYYVTKLDKAVVRMVGIELSGTYSEPAPADILRTGGDPKEGHCTLPQGGTVGAF